MTDSNTLVDGRVSDPMARTVKVPDPVYERIQRQADQQDVNHGTIVRDWMGAAEEMDELKGALR